MNHLYFPVILGILVLYLAAFSYETALSFKRLRGTKHGREGYVDATWEITHTLLVFVFTLFMITYSEALPDIAPVIFWPVLLTGTVLAIRAAFYLYIFYVRSPRRRTGPADYLFAIMHPLIIGGLVTSFVLAVIKINSLGATPNLAYFGTLLPGLIVTLLVSAWPVWRLYRQS